MLMKNLSDQQKLVLSIIVVFLLGGLALAYYLAQQVIRPPRAEENAVLLTLAASNDYPEPGEEVTLSIFARAPESTLIGGLSAFIEYDPAVIDITNVSPSEQSPFNGWTYIKALDNQNSSRVEIIAGFIPFGGNASNNDYLEPGVTIQFATINFIWSQPGPDQSQTLAAAIHPVTEPDTTGAKDDQGNDVPVVVEMSASGPPIEITPPDQTPPPSPGDTIGVYRADDGSWHLKYSIAGGFADTTFQFGPSGTTPVTGDWDGDGFDTVGAYLPADGSFRLKNSLEGGESDIVLEPGSIDSLPLSGDWDGDGTDTIGVASSEPETNALNWFLINKSTAPIDPEDITTFSYGEADDTPLVGDWDGDGTDTVGVFREVDNTAWWHLTNKTAPPFDDTITINYGAPGHRPIVGDWDGDGTDTLGIVDGNAVWHLTNLTVAQIVADPALIDPSRDDYSGRVFTVHYGIPSDTPVSGRWAPAAEEPDLTPSPTVTPTASVTRPPGPPFPTISPPRPPIGKGAAPLSFTVAFQGVTPGTIDTERAIAGSPDPQTRNVRVKIVHPLLGLSKTIEDVTVVFNGESTAAGHAVYATTAPIPLDNLPADAGYLIFIKSGQHLQNMYTENNQSSRSRGRLTSNIVLKPGGGNTLPLPDPDQPIDFPPVLPVPDTTAVNEFNFAGFPLLAGDFSDPEENLQQDGVLDTQDLVALRRRSLILPAAQTVQDLILADIDLDGAVTSRDVVLLELNFDRIFEEDEDALFEIQEQQ